MKTLVLNYSKWRCGANGKDSLGEGRTSLHNEKGLECCLGQFSLQLNKTLTENDLFKLAHPGELNKRVPFLNRRVFGKVYETKLSNNAININDNPDTTPDQKISLLRKLFLEKGFRIKVINKNRNGK